MSEQAELRLVGARVVLRPLRMEELGAVLAGRERLAFPMGRSGPEARERLVRRIERSGRLVEGWLDLAIEVGGRLVGEIDARQPPNALPPGVFELGIALFDPADRGRGYGTEAIALLTGYLFEEHDSARVQASTAVTNAAMRRVFEKLGFLEEGIMHGFMPGEDGREDYVMFGMTRTGWQAPGVR